MRRGLLSWAGYVLDRQDTLHAGCEPRDPGPHDASTQKQIWDKQIWDRQDTQDTPSDRQPRVRQSGELGCIKFSCRKTAEITDTQARGVSFDSCPREGLTLLMRQAPACTTAFPDACAAKVCCDPSNASSGSWNA